MNRDNLKAIFKEYIDHFEFLNNKKNNETYKWEIAQQFQAFDVDAVDFAGMLSKMCRLSQNLIDSSQQLPFVGLVEFAKKDPETVRNMFKDLFAEEFLSDEEKQRKIDSFIVKSEELRKKYFPDSRLYVNNQRAVMMYLFLRYPESNFGYKASEAKRFADCIGFYDDWGPMTNFNLSTFGRMCEMVIEEMRADEALMATHKSRYENTERNLHADNNLHILMLDILYTSQAYNLYSGITFNTITTEARNKYFESVKKAKELAAILEEAERDIVRLEEAKSKAANLLPKGTKVVHKRFGHGEIEEFNGVEITVAFLREAESKRFVLTTAISGGFMALDTEEETLALKEIIPILSKAPDILRNIERAQNDYEPYSCYLN